MGFDEGSAVLQLGSEMPVMSMDANGHVMLCDNGDLKAAMLPPMQCTEETPLTPAYRDISKDEDDDDEMEWGRG